MEDFCIVCGHRLDEHDIECGECGEFIEGRHGGCTFCDSPVDENDIECKFCGLEITN